MGLAQGLCHNASNSLQAIPFRLGHKLDPSINEGWEVAVKYALGDMFEGRIASWQQTATGEIKLNDSLGDSENVGATRRRGFDL